MGADLVPLVLEFGADHVDDHDQPAGFAMVPRGMGLRVAEGQGFAFFPGADFRPDLKAAIRQPARHIQPEMAAVDRISVTLMRVDVGAGFQNAEGAGCQPRNGFQDSYRFGQRRQLPCIVKRQKYNPIVFQCRGGKDMAWLMKYGRSSEGRLCISATSSSRITSQLFSSIFIQGRSARS